MKKISLILLFLTSLYAGKNVTLDFNGKFDDANHTEDTALAIIKELRPILETPMNWCNVEPTGRFDAHTTGKRGIAKLAVEVEMTCDENMAYALFRNVISRHKKFLLSHRGLLRGMISTKYPDLEFVCEIHNHSLASWIKYRNAYGGDISGSNRIKYFRMVLNDEHISPEVKKFMEYGMIVNYHRRAKAPSKTVEVFSYEVYTKTLKKKVNVRLEPVYHPTLEEGSSAKTR